MKKRYVTVVLLVIFIINVIPTMQQNVNAYTYEQWTGEDIPIDDTEEPYTIGDWLCQDTGGDNEVVLMGYIGTETNIRIPSKLKEKNVTEIDEFRLKRPEKVKSIAIPSSIKIIRDSGFSDAKYLENIIVDVDSIDFSSVDGVLFNKQKTKLLCYPQAKMGSNYSIPNSVTGICSNAFIDNKNLSSITIPDSVTSILYGAFRGMKNLLSITLPNSITSLSWDLFEDCKKLNSVVLPDSLTKIYDDAFARCTSLSSITIPDSVELIRLGAFRGCKKLNSVNIPEKVTKLSPYVFEGCSSLKTINLPNSITSIERAAFNGCTNLTGIVIPYGVTTLEESTFEGCSSLTSISLPSSIRKIGDRVFANCIKLSVINIPELVNTIGKDVFKNCKGLGYISVSTSNTKYSSVSGILFNKAKTSIITYPQNKKNTRFVIPNTVKIIEESAFEDCRFLKTITLPVKLEYIRDTSFKNCSGITSISIPDTVKKIGVDAFINCNKLVSINVDKKNAVYSSKAGVLFNKKKTTLIIYPSSKKDTTYNIPSTVKQISRRGFRNCYNLKKVICPEKLDSFNQGYAFDSCKNLTSISFSSKLYWIEPYTINNCTSLKSIHIPSKVSAVFTNAFVGCTKLSKITVDKKNKKFSSSNGVLFDKKKTRILIYPSGKKDKKYMIPSTVVDVRRYAFRGARYLETVIIPNKTKSVGEYAFSYCPKLRTVVMPNSLRTIESGITKQSKLATLYIPNNGFIRSYAEFEKIPFKIIASKITIKASTKTLKVGKSLSLKAILKPTNAVDVIKWKVSNKKNAIISSKGVVKGLKPGKVTITAYTIGGYQAKITLTIKK